MVPSKLIIIVFLLIVLLVFRFVTFFQTQPFYLDGQDLKLQVVLQDEPKIVSQGQQFTVKNEANQRISIQSNLKELYHYGDSLAIDGQLQVKSMPNRSQYLLMKDPIITVQESGFNPFLEASRFVRQKSTTLFEAVLPRTSANLLLGIVFGVKGDFSNSFFQDLQSAGVLHVIAASGMNVSFFTGAIMFSLGSFLKRRIAILLSIFAVIFYSFLVGFESSILRASFMAIIALTASFLGRQNLAFFSLFLTGLGMLLWSPAFLFDVGFQLSFMATLGILVLGERLGKLGKLGMLGEDFKTTLSAQIATLPILLATFGNVGILGILVNVLILWTVPILMVLGSAGVIAGLIFAPLGKLVIFLSLPFLVFFEKVVKFFGELHWNFVVDSFPWQFILGYYFILSAALLVISNKQKNFTSGHEKGQVLVVLVFLLFLSSQVLA